MKTVIAERRPHGHASLRINETTFTDESGKVILTIPPEKKQPSSSLKKIEIEGVTYKVIWK